MLPRITHEAAQRFGDAPAYVTSNGWALSYRELDLLSDRVAVGLADDGIGAGDVVALVFPPGPEYLVAYVATAKLGAITAGVNHKLAPSERDAIVAVAKPALILAQAGLEPNGSAPVRSISPATTPEAVLAEIQRDGQPAPLAEDANRAVAIIFTSGTTGAPKGALYTNRQLEFITTTDVGDTWGGGTRSVTGTSFAHLGFMTKLAGNLRRGGTTFIMDRWRARGCLELLARERMTTVAGVPTQLALMLADPDFDRFDLSSVQAIVVGGGPITPGLAAEARRRFGAALATRYSCTEAGVGLGTAFDDPDEDAIVSVGRPHPSVELAVLDDDDTAVPVGEVGNICLRSPAVMAGYWNDPDATRAAFTAAGHVRTGDLGWIDDRGRLRLVGRSKEMYVRGGYNVYPVEVEAVLSAHPDIEAIAIVPQTDPVMGEIGVAMAVPRPGTELSLARLREFAADQLGRYKLPEALRVLEALPLTAGDKVDRAALRALIEQPTDGG